MAGRNWTPALGVLPLLLWGPQANPLDLLAKTFDNHRRTPLEMVQIKRPFFESEEVTMRVAVDNSRLMRIDVLRPLIHQGIISLDNGRELKTFYPDKSRVIVQASPLRRQAETAARLKLISANYSLAADPGPRVAGRSTFQILLTPKNPSVPTQQILVDEEKFLPLRILAEEEKGEDRREILDTVFIKFGRPKSIKFSLPEGRGIEVIKSWGPLFISDTKDAVKSLGFTPHLPKRLPYGFTIQSIALQGSQEKPILTISLTDGILSANLFLWARSVHGTVNPISRNPLFERDGVFFAVYGDAPPHLARTLLSYFVIEKKLLNAVPDGTGNPPQSLTR